MSINRVNISGNLTRDPELRSLPSGTQVLSFGVAVNDRVRNQTTGNWEDRPNYVDCVVFGNRAEPLNRFLSKGSKVAIEPDSVLRAVQAARYAAKPIIVGGQMLNLQERSQLRTTGEQVNRADFMWGAAPHAVYDHDFAKYPLRAIGTRETHLDPKKYDSRALHRRVDVEYNGWWMCLFPRMTFRPPVCM